MKIPLCLLLASAAASFPSFAGLPGPYLVKEIAPGSDGGIPDFSRFRVLGDKLLFAATDRTTGYELWKSDGTAAGTILLKDIYPGTLGGEPYQPVVIGSTAFFWARSGSGGSKLWKSDGTAAGTTLISGIPGVWDGSSPNTQFVIGNALHVFSHSSSSGGKLWRTDGTVEGTKLVSDISFAATGTGVLIGNIYYFPASHPTSGTELWRTDGTAAGTYMVRDIGPSALSSQPAGLKAAGSVLYFVADDGTHGRELWRSNGTAGGTYMVKDIAPGTAGGTDSSAMTAAGGLVYFSAHPTASYSEWSVWRSDGTSAGTFPLLAVSNPNSNPMYVVGNEVLFVPYVSGGPLQIWKSDGTVAGTAPFKPGMTAGLSFLFTAGNSLYFGGDDLWQSDGTVAGTYPVADLTAGSTLHYGRNRPTHMAGKIYFDAYGSPGNNELYAYDLASPSISRAVVSERTRTSAKIDLAVNPNGFVTTAKLEYGTTDSYGTTVNLPLTTAGGNSSFQSLGVPLSGLTLGTTYRYRVTATSTKGTRVSTGTFDTLYTREDWRLARFGSSQNAGPAADDQDPDHDGLSNMVEYAFGLDPLRWDAAGLPKGREEYSAMIFEYTHPESMEDVSYGVEWSSTMQPGTWTPVADTGSGNHHYFWVPTRPKARIFIRWTVNPR
jgi:ELWxxDGT repeat protein